MKKGKKVEQINCYGNMEIDYDQKIEKPSEYIEIFQTIFPDVVKINLNSKKVISFTYNEKKYIILLANITYLGHPHPIFKKRIQLKNWWKEIYNNYSNSYEILFLGVYQYNGNYIFADFNISDYIHGNMNNSSAHVYTNDLYQAMINEYHHKIDKNNNKINLVNITYFKNYLNNRSNNIKNSADEILRYIDIINTKIPFNVELSGIYCYDQMIRDNYSKKFEAEWAGFYIEYLYESLLKENVPTEILTQNKFAKKKGELDFDLFSSKHNFYCDLKASNIDVDEAALNDQKNTIKSLDEHFRLWYIIYEHETIKDKDINNEVCIYWNTKQNELNGKSKELLSYSAKMKGKITFKNMFILEINKINASSILREFNQGRQTDGSPRKVKFKIKKTEIENYIIHRYIG